MNRLVPSDAKPPRPSASGRAYAYVKQQILDGEWPGDEFISEGVVAGALALSRTPVREAFLQLEAEGLLKLYPKRGALVVAVSRDEVEAVFETRLMLERFALDKVLAANVDLAAKLELWLERQTAHAGQGASGRFVAADREFHRVLVEAGGNPIMLELYDSLRDRQQRMGVANLSHDVHATERILHDHRGFVDALARGDASEAAALLTRHLSETCAALVIETASPPAAG